MNKKVKKTEEVIEEEAPAALFDAVRKIVLAGIGAVALSLDEIEDFVNRLVERGEIAEKDARKLIREVTEKRRKGAEKGMDKRLEDLLDHFNVPTKADLDELGEKIAALSTKVDALKN
jgi:polyhydroxyalkanoate synthesis regulator phasin